MMETLTLYHGSDQRFDTIDLGKAKDRRDFGRGFYMTMLKSQAEAWAKTIMLRHGGDAAFLYTFEFTVAEDLDVMRFDDLTVEWLDMIKTNRILGGIQHGFDVVIGPVANDNTFRTVTLYLEGDYTAQQAIEQLRYSRPNGQVSVHTNKALGHIKMLGCDLLGQ
jgi:hypothetical protein